MFELNPTHYQGHNYNEMTIDEIFHAHLPDNLYLNHYELNQLFHQFTPEEWRKYLKSIDRFIINEVSAITEASARQALSRLGSGQLKQGDAAAIKQLLDRSEQINTSSQDKRTFVVMQFDPSVTEPPLSWQEEMAQVMNENAKHVHLMYNLDNPDALTQFDRRERQGDFIRNIDGTLHFPNTNSPHVSDLDRAYIKLFNPENERVKELPKPPQENQGDWQ